MDIEAVIRALPKPLTVRVVRSEFGDHELYDITPDQDASASGRRKAAANRAQRRADHAELVGYLHEEGLPVSHIARRVGLSERYVRRLLRK